MAEHFGSDIIVIRWLLKHFSCSISLWSSICYNLIFIYLTFLAIIVRCLQFFPVTAPCSFCTCLTRPDALLHNSRSYHRALIIAQNNKLRLFQALKIGSLDLECPQTTNPVQPSCQLVLLDACPAQTSNFSCHSAYCLQLSAAGFRNVPISLPKMLCCPRLCKYHPKHFSFCSFR